jgi:hypothetical protein
VAGVNDAAKRDDQALVGPPVPPPTRTLNPAHAILGGAILSAIVTLVGVTLNIRSSERLSNERDKRDAAVAEAADLKDKVGSLEKKLDEALAKIPSTVANTEVAITEPAQTTLAPPPQSIVVVVTIPSAVTAPSEITTVAPKTQPPSSVPSTPTTATASTTSTSSTTSTTTTPSTSTTP